jgi:prepilin peptidase CpaA
MVSATRSRRLPPIYSRADAASCQFFTCNNGDGRWPLRRAPTFWRPATACRRARRLAVNARTGFLKFADPHRERLRKQANANPMSAQQTIWVLALAFTFAAAWVDWRTRLIPNWLTMSGIVFGIALHIWMAGWRGAIASAEGMGLALALLLPLVLLRALGAGDWKLMGAIGALLGPAMLTFVLLASILVSGAMAVALMVTSGRIRTTIRNIFSLLRGFALLGLRPNQEISLDNPQLIKLPFGVAAAAGTLICFLAAWWGR